MAENIIREGMHLYFPTVQSDQSLIDRDVGLKMGTLEGLIQSIQNDGYFHFDKKEDLQSSREALAFLIEATYQLYPDEWKNQIASIEDAIHAIRNNNFKDAQAANKEISWFLNKIIVNLYEKSLVTNSLFASKQHDRKKENFYNKVFEQHQMLSKWEHESEHRNEPVSLRRIRPEMLPRWIKKDGRPEYTKKIQDQHNSFMNMQGRGKER